DLQLRGEMAVSARRNRPREIGSAPAFLSAVQKLMWRALRKQRQSTLLQLQKPNCAEACFSKPETHRRQGLPAKPRTPNVALPLEPSQIHPVSISEPSPVCCYSSPGLHRADVLQQTKAAIYELDHTR